MGFPFGPVRHLVVGGLDGRNGCPPPAVALVTCSSAPVIPGDRTRLYTALRAEARIEASPRHSVPNVSMSVEMEECVAAASAFSPSVFTKTDSQAGASTL